MWDSSTRLERRGDNAPHHACDKIIDAAVLWNKTASSLDCAALRLPVPQRDCIGSFVEHADYVQKKHDLSESRRVREREEGLTSCALRAPPGRVVNCLENVVLRPLRKAVPGVVCWCQMAWLLHVVTLLKRREVKVRIEMIEIEEGANLLHPVLEVCKRGDECEYGYMWMQSIPWAAWGL